MDFTIEAIKGVYNEACILGESNVSVESKKSGDEIIYYSNEESHDKTFVTFEKAGIEKSFDESINAAVLFISVLTIHSEEEKLFRSKNGFC